MYELFEPLVDEIVVVVPERSKGNKNDSKDASQLDGLQDAHKRAEEWLREEAKRVAIVKTIRTAPGIADIRAAQIVATA